MWLLLCRLLVVFMVLLGIIYQFIWYARDNSLSSTITKSKWAWNNAHQIKTPRGTAHYFSLFRFLCHYIERIAVFTVSMGAKLKYYITWHGITFAESRMGKMMGFNGSWEDSTLCKLHGIMAIVTAVKTQLWVFFWVHISLMPHKIFGKFQLRQQFNSRQHGYGHLSLTNKRGSGVEWIRFITMVERTHISLSHKLNSQLFNYMSEKRLKIHSASTPKFCHHFGFDF